MQKLLIILSSSLIGANSISNLNLSNSLKLASSNKFNILDSSSFDYAKLENWHNKLTLEQDVKAKQEYLDSMIIVTSKTADVNFDDYDITFDNNKLKNMLNEKLINQDIYNIWSNNNYAKQLSYKANILEQATINSKVVTFRKYQYNFYIDNNKMHFVDKNNPNPYLVNVIPKILNKNQQNNFLDLPNYPNINSSTIKIVEKWWENDLRVELKDNLLKYLDDLAEKGFADEVEENLLKAVKDWAEAIGEEGLEWTAAEEEFFILLLETVDAFSDVSNSNLANLICSNLKSIYQADSKYHDGAEFIITQNWDPVSGIKGKFFIDKNSIKPVPPIGNGTKKWTDSLGPGSYPGYEGQNNSTNYYQYDTTLSYNGYDSLWEYLNSNVTFNLNEKFESRVGVLSKYKNYNNTFVENHSSSFLKPYLNNYLKLTEMDWKNYSLQSKAEIDLEISDNPWNKTIYFNFRSILSNCNEADDVYNYMYQ